MVPLSSHKPKGSSQMTVLVPRRSDSRRILHLWISSTHHKSPVKTNCFPPLYKWGYWGFEYTKDYKTDLKTIIVSNSYDYLSVFCNPGISTENIHSLILEQSQKGSQPPLNCSLTGEKTQHAYTKKVKQLCNSFETRRHDFWICHIKINDHRYS